jgi:hypothetical protein
MDRSQLNTFTVLKEKWGKGRFPGIESASASANIRHVPGRESTTECKAARKELQISTLEYALLSHSASSTGDVRVSDRDRPQTLARLTGLAQRTSKESQLVGVAINMTWTAILLKVPNEAQVVRISPLIAQH